MAAHKNVVERSERETLRERENSKRVMSVGSVVALEMHSSDPVVVKVTSKSRIWVKI